MSIQKRQSNIYNFKQSNIENNNLSKQTIECFTIYKSIKNYIKKKTIYLLNRCNL